MNQVITVTNFKNGLHENKEELKFLSKQKEIRKLQQRNQGRFVMLLTLFHELNRGIFS